MPVARRKTAEQTKIKRRSKRATESRLALAEPGQLDVVTIDKLRNEHIGKLLMLASREFERIAMRYIRDMGYIDLRMSHLALIRNIRAQGSRTTEIAELSNMTKQAVGQLAHELEDFGYIRRYPDPTDGRAKLVRFTGRGLEFVSRLPDALHKTEAEIAEIVGAAQFRVLRKSLQHVIASRTE